MTRGLKSLLAILESLRAKSQVVELLEQRQLPHSGTWKQVHEHIESAIEAGQISVDEITALVERIEEHGDQYAYFYDVDPVKAALLKNLLQVTATLTELGRAAVLNKMSIIASPTSTPTLVSVRPTVSGNNVSKIKLKWIQKRTFRRQIGSTTSGNIITVKYQIYDVRAVDIAEIDFENNRARLFIQKVGSSIREHKSPLEAMLGRLSPTFLQPDALQPLDLGRVLKKLNDEGFDEARRRRCQARDGSGQIIDVTSATENNDIFEPGLYKSGRDHYSGSLTALHANAYWKPVPEILGREIHLLFPYRTFSNAVVFTQRCSPNERGYVLSRVEAIARDES